MSHKSWSMSVHKISVKFYPVLKDDLLSQIVYFYYKIRNLPSDYTHCAISLDGYVYDLTIKGIGCVYEAIESQTRQARLQAVWTVNDQTYWYIMERISVCLTLELRLQLIDFIRVFVGHAPKLLCTDFVVLVLGFTPTHLLPWELAELLKEGVNVEIHQT